MVFILDKAGRPSPLLVMFILDEAGRSSPLLLAYILDEAAVLSSFSLFVGVFIF